jgi:hypothetical protein
VNIGNTGGGGITGRILIDGVEVFSQFINNADGVGVQSAIIRNVNVGSFIDFAIDSTGVLPQTGSDGALSARADGSHFSAVISTATIPEPSSLAIYSLGLALIGVYRRRQRNDRK